MLEKQRASPDNSWGVGGDDLPQTGWENSADCSSDASLVERKGHTSSDRAIKPGYFC